MSQVFDALRKAEQSRENEGSEPADGQSEHSQSPAPPAARISTDASFLGAGIRVRGEISGNESLEIAGSVEGKISLAGHRLTVGPTAKVNAGVSAQEIVLYGRVEGDLRASDRLVVKKDSTVSGQLTTARIVIEDGAAVKAKIENTPPSQ